MSDIKLFRLDGNKVCELQGHSVTIEKSLQSLIEKHLDAFFGIRFLASEYSTGKTHGGRIDTLGIDENNCPVIIEYKRALNENVINQGLFYLDWLLDHKAEFVLLVMKQFGQKAADAIDCTSPRLLCIAGDFTKYDEHAVQQINRNTELIRYRRYGDNLILFELVNATTAEAITEVDRVTRHQQNTFVESLALANTAVKDRFESLRAFVLALGDDVQEKTLKFYDAFRRFKNFACVEVRPQLGTIFIYARINPETIELEKGFTRDVRKIGHYGTGDLEIAISSDTDLERAKPLLLKGYEAS